MRIFVATIILIFSFQSLTKSDDVTSFELEGISIGTSLLDYFSEEEIIKNKEQSEERESKNKERKRYRKIKSNQRRERAKRRRETEREK